MMRGFFRKQILIPLILAVLAGSVIAVWYLSKEGPVEPTERAPEYQIIGTSVEGRPIEAYNFLSARSTQAGRSGERHLVFIGGMHGGYEWNSVVLSYQFMDYLEDNPSIIPEGLIVTVIPSANPDGVFAVVGREGRFTRADVPARAQRAGGSEETEAGLGRFNARGVDLNRNFDCKWQEESMWRGNTVSAGMEAFSEPESRAIRDFVLKYSPDAVIFWHSQSNTVYASECEDGILPETLAIMHTYSGASGYPAVESFDHYEITGDAEGWLASISIPAITVELSTHETIEWQKNLAGIMALFEYYREL